MNHYFTNENLPSNLKKINVSIKDKIFTFYTDNGVFSKKRLDFGSRSLINCLLDLDIKGDVLDLGCGYGVVGIILSSFFDIDVDMVDVNKRALHLANMNIKENNIRANVFESNIYENINKKYDYIITNPPIRTGKDTVYKFLFGAKDYLKDDGYLIYVINKEQGAKSSIKDLEKVADIKVLDKNKGFFVICCNFR